MSDYGIIFKEEKFNREGKEKKDSFIQSPTLKTQ